MPASASRLLGGHEGLAAAFKPRMHLNSATCTSETAVVVSGAIWLQSVPGGEMKIVWDPPRGGLPCVGV